MGLQLSQGGRQELDLAAIHARRNNTTVGLAQPDLGSAQGSPPFPFTL